MPAAIRTFVLAWLAIGCANAGHGGDDSPPKLDAGVGGDAPPLPVDAPRLIDAPLSIDAAIDAPGLFCTTNSECTVAGECCVTLGGPQGFCAPGTVVVGVCVPL